MKIIVIDPPGIVAIERDICERNFDPSDLTGYSADRRSNDDDIAFFLNDDLVAFCNPATKKPAFALVPGNGQKGQMLKGTIVVARMPDDVDEDQPDCQDTTAADLATVNDWLKRCRRPFIDEEIYPVTPPPQ